MALLAARLSSPIFDGLAVTILMARTCQSLIHVLLEQTNLVVAVRFAFFFVQAISIIAMGVLIALGRPVGRLRVDAVDNGIESGAER